MKFDKRNNYKNTDRSWPAGTRIFALPDQLGWIALDPNGQLSFISPGYAAVTNLEKVDEVLE